MQYYPSGLSIEMFVQPALDVVFMFLEGDVLYSGTVGTVQIELKDRAGEPFNPVGEILISVYSVTEFGGIQEPAAIFGAADQEVQEMIPVCGRYFFEFDTKWLPQGTTRALVRAAIPYQGMQVLWQRTVQLADPNLVV